MDNRMMPDMAGWMAAGMGVAWLVWVLFSLALLVLVILGIRLLLRLLRDSSAGAGRRARPMEELDARYARGEIDRETYLQMRRDLREQ